MIHDNFLQTTQMSVAAIKRLSDQSQLDVRPPFQRNPVWLDGQKSYLVDSILRGYPVPEMYMQVTTTAAGEERHIVVDGQQRITAILDFIEGKFALSGLNVPWDDGPSFEDLAADEKQRIFSYSFVVRLLPELADEEIRAIFQRLNRNVVALSRQELRHATYWGQFITSMEFLATHEFWRHAGVFTANEVRRMLDVEFISELAIGVMHGPQNKKLSLERWYQVYEEEFPQRDELETTFADVLGELDQLLPGLVKSRWSKKSDFYTLFLYLAERRAELPFASEVRNATTNDLVEFAREVDRVLRLDPRQSAEVVSTVLTYARSVQRAASDLGNRRARVGALSAFMAGQRDVTATGSDAEDDIDNGDVPEDEYEEE